VSFEIYKEFRFDAAHSLPNVPPDHPCFRLHGHTFRVRVFVQGTPLVPEGWVVDFRDIKRAFRPILKMLDHNHLNEIDGLENPTAENLARWIFEQLEPSLPGLSAIEVGETSTSGCTYRKSN